MPANYNENFAKAFRGFEDSYVLIGGTATTIVLDLVGLHSRATKDYDLVIIDENKDRQFYDVLTQFLNVGDYSETLRDEKAQLFRFVTDNINYPPIIELFCISPQFPLQKIGRTTPISFEEGASLSAILLDKEYYDLMVTQKIIEKGYSILNDKGLIIFKAKAWLDMRKRRSEGEGQLSKEIKKHLNDVIHLSLLISPDERLSHLTRSKEIKEDMSMFMHELLEDKSLIPKFKDIDETPEEILKNLKSFLLE
jgi:hypothetical protein